MKEKKKLKLKIKKELCCEANYNEKEKCIGKKEEISQKFRSNDKVSETKTKRNTPNHLN